MKRFLMVFTIIFIAVLVFSVMDAQAVTNKNVWISVTIIDVPSIVILNGLVATNWVVSMPFNAFTNSPQAIVISNDGLVTEELSLQLESLGTVGFDGWTNSINMINAVDTYVLQGVIRQESSGVPLLIEWSADPAPGDEDVITVNPVTCTSEVLGIFSDPDNGVSVQPTEKRDMWLRLQAPNGGLKGVVVPTMRVIVSATAL